MNLLKEIKSISSISWLISWEDSRKFFILWPLSVTIIVLYGDRAISWRRWTVLPIYCVTYPYRRVWLRSWKVRLCLPPWILFVGFSGRAISWFFLCRAWHCGMLSHSILLACIFVSVGSCQLALHPCYSSWLPSKLGVQARLVSGNFSHRQAGMVTCLWGFCKLSCMPRVHQEACSSILSPFHWSSSVGYF